MGFGQVSEWVDSLYQDNHNLVKVTLPNGMEYAVDFQQHNIHKFDSNGRLIPPQPIVRPWKEVVSEWHKRLGELEFKDEDQIVD